MQYLLPKMSMIDHRFEWISSERDSCEIVFLRKLGDLLKMLFNKIYVNAIMLNKNSFLSTSKIEKRPVSMRNIGLNCYLNSSFQSIVACNRFVEEMKILETQYPRSINLHIFNKILNSLCDNSSDDVELSSNSILANWNKSGEQDTFELLSYVIFQVFNELRVLHQINLPIEERTMENWIKKELPLKLLIEFRIKCNCGQYFTPTIQSDLALHLSVPFRIYSDPKPFTIEKLLDNYFIPENISDFPCLNNDCENAHVTKFIILKKPMPSTLCLHIQRSFWNGQNNRMEKNNERVYFEEKLVLKKEFFIENKTYRDDGLLRAVCLNICNTENLFCNKMETEVCVEKRKEIYEDNIDHIKAFEISKFRNLNFLSTSNLKPQEKINDSETSPIEIKKINEDSIFPKIELSTNMSSEFSDNEKFRNSTSSIENKVNQWSENVVSQAVGDGVKEKIVAYQSEIDRTSNLVNNPNIVSQISELTMIQTIKDPKLFNRNHETHSSIENVEYFLKSVIVHFGRAESGHYICYRKCGSRWFCTNDNFITEVSFKEVKNSQAYILMYERDD